MQLRDADNHCSLNKQLQRRYDAIASRWNTGLYDGTRRDDLIPFLIRASKVENGMTVLEAMSGTGTLSSELKTNFPHSKVYSLDFSLGMLMAAGGGSQRIQATVLAAPFADETFDRTFLRSAIYDLPRRYQLAALKEVRRILKREGIFVLQTYYTTPKTRRVLNSMVNIKDLASGYYGGTEAGMPRYFATADELEKWFFRAGFRFSELKRFEGKIRYIGTGEMTERGLPGWIKYVTSLSTEMKEAIKLRSESGGALIFNFPGAIYRLR